MNRSQPIATPLSWPDDASLLNESLEIAEEHRYAVRVLDDGARRLLDVVAALTGLALLWPFLLLLGLAVKLQDTGPALYRAARVGKDGKLFDLYKFRTMVVGADQLGAGITTSGDPRVTRLGRWLRRTKLDELPQLLNVLRGDMSLVGPRPEDPRYARLYTPEQGQILRVRPGITSPASLAYRAEEQTLIGPDWETTYCGQVMQAKLAIDLDYLAQRTVRSDIHVVLRTIASIFDNNPTSTFEN